MGGEERLQIHCHKRKTDAVYQGLGEVAAAPSNSVKCPRGTDKI